MSGGMEVGERDKRGGVAVFEDIYLRVVFAVCNWILYTTCEAYLFTG